MRYNTVKGIETYLSDLDGLHQLIQDRIDAVKRAENLDSFIVLGKWQLDEYGQVSKCDYEIDYCLVDLARSFPKVTTQKEMFGVHEKLSIRTNLGRSEIPPSREVCQVCLNGWDIQNVRDAVCVRNSETEIVRFEHLECNRLRRNSENRKFFEGIFQRAGFLDFKMIEIPNQYHRHVNDGEYHPPWVRFETTFGRIKIGWRKHVMNIDWSGTGGSFPDLFKEDQVTKGATSIHAGSQPKAIEYLTKVREELIKEFQSGTQSSEAVA